MGIKVEIVDKVEPIKEKDYYEIRMKMWPEQYEALKRALGIPLGLPMRPTQLVRTAIEYIIENQDVIRQIEEVK